RHLDLNHLLTRAGRLRPADECAVDEERVGAIDSRPGPFLQISFNLCLEPSTGQTILELLGIEPNACSMFHQGRPVELALVFKQPVMILPKLALFPRAPGSLGGALRLGMDLPQGKIPVG